jgi:heme/copper-type cytochrome/quinol oxidase subunit 1
MRGYGLTVSLLSLYTFAILITALLLLLSLPIRMIMIYVQIFQ